MAQKINPISFRLGNLRNWQSRWFADTKARRYFLQEDETIRKIVDKKLKDAGIASVEIERLRNVCRINIKAAKPGLVIGRGGKGIEDLTRLINKAVFDLRKKEKIADKSPLNLNVIELSRNEVSAQVVARNIAGDLERRYKFRKTMKKHLDEIMSHREVKGAKIRVGGRLNGAEIARTEWLKKGTLPLAKIRADIDYGEATAFTTYGTIGIKVWVNKGEVFAKEEKR
jgi:small subunit ribosomal protein S3